METLKKTPLESEETANSQYGVFLLCQGQRQHMFLADSQAPETEIVYFNEAGLASFFFPYAISSTTEQELSFEVVVKNQQYCRIGVATGNLTHLPVFGVGSNSPIPKPDDVTDTAESFGLDPLNGLFWKDGVQSQFGEPCVSGDLIRCVVKNREISFWKNGDFMGVAARNIGENSKTEYYPGFTCGRFQSLGFRKESEGSIKLYEKLVIMRGEQQLQQQRYEELRQLHQQERQDQLHWQKQYVQQLDLKLKQQQPPLSPQLQLQQLHQQLQLYTQQELLLQQKQKEQLAQHKQQEQLLLQQQHPLHDKKGQQKQQRQLKPLPPVDPKVSNLHLLAFFGKQPSEGDLSASSINEVTALNVTPLMWACAMHNNTMVNLLLKRGCDVTVSDWLGCTVVDVAALVGNWKVMRTLLWDYPSLIKSGSTFLLIAFCSLFGHYATLVELLKHPFGRQHVNMHFPLHAAAANNHYYICLLLLDNGADPNLQGNIKPEPTNSSKQTDQAEPKAGKEKRKEADSKTGREFHPTSEAGYRSSSHLLKEAASLLVERAADQGREADPKFSEKTTKVDRTTSADFVEPKSGTEKGTDTRRGAPTKSRTEQSRSAFEEAAMSGSVDCALLLAKNATQEEKERAAGQAYQCKYPFLASMLSSSLPLPITKPLTIYCVEDGKPGPMLFVKIFSRTVDELRVKIAQQLDLGSIHRVGYIFTKERVLVDDQILQSDGNKILSYHLCNPRANIKIQELVSHQELAKQLACNVDDVVFALPSARVSLYAEIDDTKQRVVWQVVECSSSFYQVEK